MASILDLRALLVSLELLPSRDPLIAKIESAIVRRAAELSNENSRILRSFGKWSVIRKARCKADLKRLTVSGAKNAVTEVHEAARFLLWLEQESIALQEVTQSAIDMWLLSGAKARFAIRGFTVWAGEGNCAPEW